MDRPNILLLLTDQLRSPPSYESRELADYRRRQMPGQTRLAESGVSFARHYPMATACAPSRASLLTGQYPSLHGVTQTDGLAKSADSADMYWLAPDTVPTMGDWFRAGGYRTFFKGKWHASHAHLGREGRRRVPAVDRRQGQADPREHRRVRRCGPARPLRLLGVGGPEPHGLGKHNTGTVKDPFTADETIELLGRARTGEDGDPWLRGSSTRTLTTTPVRRSGRPRAPLPPLEAPHIDKPPTHHEDLPTKPACHQSMVDLWSGWAPRSRDQTHLKFYYQLQAAVDEQIARVLDALRAAASTRTRSSCSAPTTATCRGPTAGCTRSGTTPTRSRCTCLSWCPAGDPGRQARARHPHQPRRPHPDAARARRHRPGSALAKLQQTFRCPPARGRDLSPATARRTRPARQPVLSVTDDEISEGGRARHQPVPGGSPALARVYATVEQPNHIETVIAEVDIEGAPHLVKFSRYHDSQQFWTVRASGTSACAGARRSPSPSRSRTTRAVRPDAPPTSSATSHTPRSPTTPRETAAEDDGLLTEQIEAKRLVPLGQEPPGYRPPAGRLLTLPHPDWKVRTPAPCRRDGFGVFASRAFLRRSRGSLRMGRP